MYLTQVTWDGNTKVVIKLLLFFVCLFDGALGNLQVLISAGKITARLITATDRLGQTEFVMNTLFLQLTRLCIDYTCFIALLVNQKRWIWKYFLLFTYFRSGKKRNMHEGQSSWQWHIDSVNYSENWEIIRKHIKKQVLLTCLLQILITLIHCFHAI